MKRNLHSLLLMTLTLVFLGTANAQTVSITANASTTQPNGLGTGNYHVSEYVYTDTELGSTNFLTVGTAINRINLNATVVGTPNFFNNVKVYLMNVPITTTALTAGTYSTTGYTEVFSGTFTAPAAGWVGVTLTTPFVRTVGTNLQMMIERTDNVDHSIGAALFTWASANGNNLSATATTSRRYNGTAALSASTALSASAFRVATQFIHATTNDASVSNIYALGKTPTPQNNPQPITVTVSNNGLAALTNLPVTLNVTGSNTASNVQTVASLPAFSSTTVTFTGISTTNTGTNTLTVSVPSDDDNANNSTTFTQTVANNGFSYANSGAATTNGGVGFGAGAGLLVSKHQFSGAVTITGVRVFISSKDNAVFGAVCDASGTILAQSANYTPTVTDSLTYVNFNFTTPVTIAANTAFFVGLGQTAGTYPYYPVGTQVESPARGGTYGSMALAGGTPTFYTTLGRFMIEGIINSAAPITLASFSGVKQGQNNLLSWTTANETNNTGFELQRSADGKNFSALSFVPSKSFNGNSNASLSYEFADTKAITAGSYYRLKQIDKDGRSSVSAIVFIKGLKATKLEVVSIYPNPVKDMLNMVVASPKADKVSFIITDLAGKTVINQMTSVNDGDNNIQLNVSSLAKGSYSIRVVCDNGCETVTSKFIKQ